MATNNTTLSAQEQMNNIVSKVNELASSKDVQEYLALIEKAEQLEKSLKEEVKKYEATVEYFDPIKMSEVKIIPQVRTSYKLDKDEVLIEFGDKYFTSEINVKMMEASPECGKYLSDRMETKIIPTKRVIKK